MEMELEKREALRYLGYGTGGADRETEKLLEDCLLEAKEAADLRHVCREYSLSVSPEGLLDCGIFQTESRSLKRVLKDCDRVLFMAATLGSGVDRLLFRYGKLSIARAVFLQAASAAMIESYCNGLCAGWKREYEKQGLFLRPRFSPGYGDFPLSVQPAVLRALEAEKRIGLTLTDGFLMLPSKSVTAVMGISRTPAFCAPEGCEACGKTDCAYRR